MTFIFLHRGILPLLSLYLLLSSAQVTELGNPVTPLSFPSSYAGSVFPDYYDILAPFPIGTRELGADPLEAFGGIRNIPRADSSTYPSDLYFGSKVTWATAKTSAGQVTVQWNSSMVNWDLITEWAGSAGGSFQGWAVGDILVPSDTKYTLYCWSVSSVYIDDELFVGDRYGAGMISNAVSLPAGKHTFYVPFTSSTWGCALSPITSPLSVITAGDEMLAIPDLVSYANSVFFTSPYIALSLFNADPLEIMTSITISSKNPFITIQQNEFPSILPGQTRPVTFMVTSELQECAAKFTFNVSISFTQSGSTSSMEFPITTNCYSWPLSSVGGLIFTFPDFDGSIQYAAFKPPLYPCTAYPRGCSILFTLHGAGVSSSSFWGSFYQPQNYSWVLLPTNRRFYGFDWQGPGLKNALGSLRYLVGNLPGIPVGLKGEYGADEFRLIYAGHSMGGHGCWLMSSHFPDRALGVAPASGWVNFPLYVPYFTRNGISLTDPYLLQILDFSIAHDSPDYYLPHLVGIPTITRFGSLDDNVPPYHMRRMGRLIDQLSRNATWTEVSEVPGAGHWWNDVVDGPPMQDFFNRNAIQPNLPPLPTQFTVVTMNPSSSESKGGIKILQLEVLNRGGYIRVVRNKDRWNLYPQNVRRFSFVSFPTLISPGQIQIGKTVLPAVRLPAHYFFNGYGWEVRGDQSWMNEERHADTYGPFWQIIQGPLTIIYGTQGSSDETALRRNYALYIANTLYYKGKYQVDVLSDQSTPPTTSNLLLIGGPSTNYMSLKLSDSFPVSFAGRIPSIGGITFGDPGTGILFLSRGTQWNTLLAVLEGVDEKGLGKALGLFPLSSGVTMPDYAVAGPNWGWAGSGGLLAAGYWDNHWNYSYASSYTTLNLY
eukprot:TRINITY_DN18322_c0_g1_i1.p1 TRINITY_DN18322_c0_g1~~TRINITY_DN18322_c0_g1_i1.p1  ORF type:complete len:882 (+),score=166.68 TRINITY_DN18322_c0_g1_i1:32-2677(+)